MISPSTIRPGRARWMILGLTLVAILFAAQVPAIAQDADALAKKADTELRAAQRSMFSRKFDDAREGLAAAKDLIEKLKAADPEHRRLKRLESKLARQTRDLDRRTKRATPRETGGKVEAGKTLPRAVVNRLQKIDRAATRIDALFAKDRPDDWKLRQFPHLIEGMKGIMAEIRKSYGAKIPAGDPQVKARLDRIAAIDKKLRAYEAEVAKRRAASAEDRAAREKQSAVWLARLRPYVTPKSRPNHDAKKYLVPAGTADLKELERRKKIFDEANASFRKYEKTKFPAGKTDELSRVEKALAYALSSFDKGYEETLAGFSYEAEKRIAQAAAWLKAEEAKEDGKRRPATLQQHLIPNIRKMIALAAGTTAKKDPKTAKLSARLTDVEKRNEKLRRLRKERTFLTPDRYRGDDLRLVKKKAGAFLHEKYRDAKILRTTVVSADWKEERVLEPTDTTASAIRYRVTRSVTAQVAGKRGKEVVLYTVHVAKDRRTDGSWGVLYGHVMFEDPMLEKHVKPARVGP